MKAIWAGAFCGAVRVKLLSYSPESKKAYCEVTSIKHLCYRRGERVYVHRTDLFLKECRRKHCTVYKDRPDFSKLPQTI